MPIYEYECFECEHRFEIVCSYEDKKDHLDCEVCNGIARYMPSRFFGVMIPAERLELKAKGIIPKEPGLDKQAKENKAYLKEKKRKQIRKAVEQAVMECTDLPA